jgi:hypothetical protein
VQIERTESYPSSETILSGQVRYSKTFQRTLSIFRGIQFLEKTVASTDSGLEVEFQTKKRLAH